MHAGGVFIYITAVVSVLFNKKIFENEPEFFIPVFMLLLFVISASITGLLVLGRPICLYMDGFKKEAFTLLFSTIAWLAVFLIPITGLLVFL